MAGLKRYAVAHSRIATSDYDQRKRGAAMSEVQQRVDIHAVETSLAAMALPL